MKFLSYQRAGQTGIGLLTRNHDTFVDLTRAAPGNGGAGPFSSMLSLIDAGPGVLDDVGRIASQAEQTGGQLETLSQLDTLSNVQLLPPLPEPRQMRDANNFPVHIDFSARDTQIQEMQSMMGPAKGKSFDGSNVIGPWLVAKDEVPDPRSLTMSVRVNGEVWSTGNSSDMPYSFEDMIADVSRSEALRAGELFGSGTVGNGSGLELGRFLQDGDSIEIDRPGTLRNTVASGRASLTEELPPRQPQP